MSIKTKVYLAGAALVILCLFGGGLGGYFIGKNAERTERAEQRARDSVKYAETIKGARDTAECFEDTLRVVRNDRRILEIQLANQDEYYKKQIAEIKLQTAKQNYEQIIKIIGQAKDTLKPYCFDSAQVGTINLKIKEGEECADKLLTLKGINETYYKENELLLNQKMKYLDIMNTQGQMILDKDEEIRELKEVPFISWNGLSAVVGYGNAPGKLTKFGEGIFRTGFETEFVIQGKFYIEPGIYYTNIQGKDLLVSVKAGIVILGRK